jgi:predicted thioesterase
MQAVKLLCQGTHKVKEEFLSKACFTLGVRANVQLKSSIPIGAKVQIITKVLMQDFSCLQEVGLHPTPKF